MDDARRDQARPARRPAPGGPGAADDARYSSLFTHHPHATYSVDRRGYYTDANARALEMTGLSLEEMRRTHFAEVIHPDDAHLEYGPLSSELRNWAITDARFPADTVEGAAAQFMWGCHFNRALNDNDGIVPVIGDNDTLMAMLFIAELLADEGL